MDFGLTRQRPCMKQVVQRRCSVADMGTATSTEACRLSVARLMGQRSRACTRATADPLLTAAIDSVDAPGPLHDPRRSAG